MSHPKALIERITELVEAQYPRLLFDYVFEKAIPGTRLFPDITIRNSDKRIVCVVEIGYTRPEKLTAYRTSLNISDVRWYDKQGQLHTSHEVTSVHAQVELTGKLPTEVAVYVLDDHVSCRDCSEEFYRDRWSDEGYAQYVEAWKAEGYGDDPPTQETLTEEALNEQCWYVTTVAITDYIKVFLPSFCDKCGLLWLANEEEAQGFVLDLGHHGLKDVGLDYGARTLMSWEQACALVADKIGEIKVNYIADGIFLDREDQARFERAVRAVVRLGAQPTAPEETRP